MTCPVGRVDLKKAVVVPHFIQQMLGGARGLCIVFLTMLTDMI